MDISSLTSTTYAPKSPAQQSREVRQATQTNGVQEKIQQRFQTEGRHEAKARFAQAAFEDSVGVSDKARLERLSQGVDQLVRGGVRNRAEESWETTDSEAATQRYRESRETSREDSSRDDYVRNQVNAAYSETTQQQPVRSSIAEPRDRADEQQRPEQVNTRQQQRGAEVYQDSERSGIDRTVELVI